MAMTSAISATSHDQAHRRLEKPLSPFFLRCSGLGPRWGRQWSFFHASPWRDHYESGLRTIPSSKWRKRPFATVPRPPMGLYEFMVVFFNSLAVGFDVIDAEDNVAALQ